MLLSTPAVDPGETVCGGDNVTSSYQRRSAMLRSDSANPGARPRAKCVLLATLLAVAAIGSAAVPARSSQSRIEAAVSDQRRNDADRERDETSKPIEVLEFFGIKPGMRVLDLLSGGGYYSEILAYAVGPEGSVVAHTNDIYEKYHAVEIAARYRDNRLPNADRLISNPPELKLESEAFDVILMILTYHDIYYVSESNPTHPEIDRARFFAQIHRALKPGGALAIVDHSARAGTGKRAAQDLHRIDESFARKDIESAGFVFESESDVLRNAGDDKAMLVFDDRIRRKTDRFVYRFIKVSAP
jgi:predicted methyltransferase